LNRDRSNEWRNNNQHRFDGQNRNQSPLQSYSPPNQDRPNRQHNDRPRQIDGQNQNRNNNPPQTYSQPELNRDRSNEQRNNNQRQVDEQKRNQNPLQSPPNQDAFEALRDDDPLKSRSQ
jgi:hypothetical protein